MPARLTVYCTLPVDDVTAAELVAAINEADTYTDAEVWGIEDEALVDDALAHLRFDSSRTPTGAKLVMHYTASNTHTVCVDFSGCESSEEMLEELADVTANGVDRVRSVLHRTVGEVHIALRWEQLGDMAIGFASRVAEILAACGRGLIRDQNDDWWAINGGVPELVLKWDRGEGTA